MKYLVTAHEVLVRAGRGGVRELAVPAQARLDAPQPGRGEPQQLGGQHVLLAAMVPAQTWHHISCHPRTHAHTHTRTHTAVRGCRG
jgi:hypothetical protein